MKRKQTEEFKVQALELVNQLGSFAEASEQLGITDSLLHVWKAKYNFKLNSSLEQDMLNVASPKD